MIYLKVIVKGGHNMTYSEQMLDQLEAGKLKEAQNSFKLALINDDDDMLFSLAEELYALGFLQQARTIYLKLLDRYPDEDELKTNLATIAIDEGHNDEALSYLAQIKPDSPAYVQSLLVAADLYQTEEEFEVTEEKLKEAYALAPDEPVAAEITSHLGDQKLMKKYLVKAHELAPENMTITLQYSNFLLHQHDDEANIKLLSPLVKEDETDPQLYWNLARSYQRTDQLELAGKYYEAALPAYSENPTFLKELINYYRETGETDKLMDELEHYLRLVPTDTEMQDLYDQYEDYK